MFAYANAVCTPARAPFRPHADRKPAHQPHAPSPHLRSPTPRNRSVTRSTPSTGRRVRRGRRPARIGHQRPRAQQEDLHPRTISPARTPKGRNVPANSSRPVPKCPAKQGATGGLGGSPPDRNCEPSRSPPKAGEHRATPGGYGGKPPGVAFIGVPTGARNAGSGAPTGDQSTGMHVTRNPPLVCQDPPRSPSRDRRRFMSSLRQFPFGNASHSVTVPARCTRGVLSRSGAGD